MNNWKLTISIALSFILFSIVFFGVLGWSEDSLLLILRISARVAIGLFLLAFLASTFVKIKSTGFTKWALKNRRYIGVGFAIIHTIHLGFIFARHFIYEPTLLTTEIGSRIFAGIAYLFIFFMTLTSFNSISKKMKRKTWSLLHSVGGYYIWFIFFMSYVKRLGREDILFYAFFGLLLSALVVKIALKLKGRAKK